MQRLLTTVTLVGLLVATAAAFAITERLKLTKSPISRTYVYPKSGFSPTCGCARGKVAIRVNLRHADAVTVRLLDANDRPVRTLVEDLETRRGFSVYRWDGRTDANIRAPDGVYRAEIHLARQHRTILLPNEIRLDTKAPTVERVELNRQTFSPDGDRQSDFVRLTYELGKPARVVLYRDGEPVLRSKRSRATGSVSWYGDRLPPGRYDLELGAVDAAGNSTPVAARWHVQVRIRFVELTKKRIRVRAGLPFRVAVSTDAKQYSWKLGQRTGIATTRVLELAGPQPPGRYTLTVRVRRHVSRAAVISR